MSYAKLFSSITESSLWGEAKETRLLFVTMLAKANAIGFVEASIPGLARVANLSQDEVEASVKVLESPDPYSKNPEFEGRRITKVPGGWMIINYEDYRSRTSEEERRQYMREYMRERRRQERLLEDQKEPVLTSLTNVKKSKESPSASASSSSSKKKERGIGGEGEEETSVTKVPQQEIEDFVESIGLPRSDGEAMFLHWQEQPAEKTRKIKNWRMTIKKWKSFGYLPSQKGVAGKNGPQRPRVLSFAEREKRIGQVRERRNALWKSRKDDYGGMREFTPEESAKFDALTKELSGLENN